MDTMEHGFPPAATRAAAEIMKVRRCLQTLLRPAGRPGVCPAIFVAADANPVFVRPFGGRRMMQDEILDSCAESHVGSGGHKPR